MTKESLGDLVRILIVSGNISESELTPIMRIGVARMTGEREELIFNPLGFLSRDMSAGEPIYTEDIRRIVFKNNRDSFKR